MTNKVIEHTPTGVGEYGAPAESAALTKYMPDNIKELAWFANQVATSGLFRNGSVPLTGGQAFILMVKGAELGMTPMQSLSEIHLIEGKPVLSAAAIASRIRRVGKLTDWDVDSDDKHCTITFKRAGDREPKELTTTIEKIPQRYFQPSRSGKPSNWTLIPEDMLFSWTIKRLARRYFPEALLDLGGSDDTRDIVDVAPIEQAVGPENAVGTCEECGEPTYLHRARNGGAYSECAQGHRQSPPQAVRDAMRGRVEDFNEVIDSPSNDLPESTVEPGLGNGRDATPEELSDLGPSAVEAELASQVATEPLPEVPAEPAPVVPEPSFSEQWHVNAADVIIGHIASTKGAKRAAAVTAIQNLGWTEKTQVTIWVQKQSNETLTTLLERFGLKVGIRGTLEASDEHGIDGTGSDASGDGAGGDEPGDADRTLDFGAEGSG